VVADFLSPRGTIEMSRALYRTHWRDTRVTRVLVKCRDGETESVQAEIARRLGHRFGLRTLRIGSLIEWFASQVRRAFNALYILALLVFMVVLVGVGDALAAGMLERTREVGIIRAIGVRRRAISGMVLIEGLALGLFGVAQAWMLGVALGVMWVKLTFPTLLGWTLTLHVPWREILLVGGAGVSICLIAAYLPAAWAARLDPIEALRAE
jgi:putative ABC transport system permease protein